MAAAPDPLSALAWLVEAGADEAVGDVPADRFQAKTPKPSSPPLERGSKSPKDFPASAKATAGQEEHLVRRSFSEGGSGRGTVPGVPYPSPKSASQISTLPQGENGDSVGYAIALARAAGSLAELKTA